MKSLITLSAVLLMAFRLNAQSNSLKDSLLNLFNNDASSFYNLKNNYFQKNNKLSAKIPLITTTPKTVYGGVLNLPKPTLTYIDNVNHFDIYKASPDNMYIISPDSTIKLN